MLNECKPFVNHSEWWFLPELFFILTECNNKPLKFWEEFRFPHQKINNKPVLLTLFRSYDSFKWQTTKLHEILCAILTTLPNYSFISETFAFPSGTFQMLVITISTPPFTDARNSTFHIQWENIYLYVKDYFCLWWRLFCISSLGVHHIRRCAHTSILYACFQNIVVQIYNKGTHLFSNTYYWL